MKRKTERVIQFLCEEHLWIYGGYPYDSCVLADQVVIASLDDAKERNRTSLEFFSLSLLNDWYDRAREYIKQNKLSAKWPTYTGSDFGDWAEAFNETRSGVEDR